MKALLIIAWIGNLIDTVSTLILFHVHQFTEANPLMARLLQMPWLFAAVKLTVMTAVVIRLWRNRNNRYARIASWVAAATYGVISVYYMIFFVFLLR